MCLVNAALGTVTSDEAWAAELPTRVDFVAWRHSEAGQQAITDARVVLDRYMLHRMLTAYPMDLADVAGTGAARLAS